MTERSRESGETERDGGGAHVDAVRRIRERVEYWSSDATTRWATGEPAWRDWTPASLTCGDVADLLAAYDTLTTPTTEGRDE